jgi:hypothetical protein
MGRPGRWNRSLTGRSGSMSVIVPVARMTPCDTWGFGPWCPGGMCHVGPSSRWDLPTVLLSESLPAVPDEALTVEMLSEGAVELLRFSDDVMSGSVSVRSLFRTKCGTGLRGHHDTQSGEQCFGIATRDSTGGNVALEVTDSQR